MLNKVEICGVNTASLPVLSNKEKEILLNKIKNGDSQARQEFINGNLKLVLSVIKRFRCKSENADDLFQVGCIGLIKALDNFDVNQNVQFSTYAVPMIIGEIRRYLRDNNPIRVSRSIRDLAYRSLMIKEKLLKETGQEPTIEQIAKILEIDKEEVLFEGKASDAVKEFPYNINVAATISLACNMDINVKIIVDPNVDRNVHEISAIGDFGEFKTTTMNYPCAANPKTSMLAALSAINLLRSFNETISVGF